MLASGSIDKSIILWNTVTREKITTLLGHTNYIYSMCFSPDGNTLASASDDNTIKLWDKDKYEEITTFEGYTVWVESV